MVALLDQSAFGGFVQGVLQPRYVMGMAMTILSFSMLANFAHIEPRQLRPADLDPVKVWQGIDDRTHRIWDRTMKYYDNLRLVIEIQSRLKEWTDQDPASAGAQRADRKLNNGRKSQLMNCANHPEAPAIGYCRECGKPLCEACRREADGTFYCEQHSPWLQRHPCLRPRARPYQPRLAYRHPILRHIPRRTPPSHIGSPEYRPDSRFCWDSFPAWAPFTTANT